MLHIASCSWIVIADIPTKTRAKWTSESDSLTQKTPTHQFSLWVLVVVVVQNGGGGVGSGREGGRRATTTTMGVAARLGRRGGAHGWEWPREVGKRILSNR